MNSSEFYKLLQSKVELPPRPVPAKQEIVSQPPVEKPPATALADADTTANRAVEMPAQPATIITSPANRAEMLTAPMPIKELAPPAGTLPAAPEASIDMLSRMMANLTDEQKRKLTPSIVEKGMKIMDQLHLKVEDIEALSEKFSSLMPKGSNGKGFDVALYAMDRLSAEQIKPILDFAQDIGTGDARLLKSIGRGSMPADPEKLIDKTATMTPGQIEHSLGQVREGLALYHQIPPEFRGIAKSLFLTYGPRPHF